MHIELPSCSHSQINVPTTEGQNNQQHAYEIGIETLVDSIPLERQGWGIAREAVSPPLSSSSSSVANHELSSFAIDVLSTIWSA